MKTKTLTISRGAKFSKNYNTLESHVSLTVELDDKDSFAKVYEETAKLVGDTICDDLDEHIEDMKALAKEKGF